MLARFLVSSIAALVLVFAGIAALGTAITPPALKIIATVVACPHPDSSYVASYARTL
ncbi:MAG TPA: hypothetical protein VMF11_07495 [Candidatus Baltobacteraceae bacterium]|nr:hypothetical protein [Candidatus Baltobacteraceae bacterium]